MQSTNSIMYCCGYKKLITVSLLMLSTTALKSQPGYLGDIFKRKKDSLVTALKKYPSPDTARVNALFRILDCSTYLREKKEVLPYWEEALTLSRQLNYKRAEAACLVWKGSFFKSAKKIDSALLYMDSGIVVTGQSSDARLKETKAFALFNKGMIFENQEIFYGALQNYFEAIKNYDTTHSDIKQVLHIRIAEIYQRLNNDDLALQHYQEALQINAFNSENQLNLSIAEIYYHKNDLIKAKSYLALLDKFMPDTTETLVTGPYYRLKGNIALKEKKTDSSLVFLKEALKYFNLTRQMHADLIAHTTADISILKIENGDMKEAKEYADESIAAATESNHKGTMANALAAMALYYNKTGNRLKAYEALQKAMRLNDSVLTEANIKQANTLAAVYENDKKEKAIDQLQADKKIQAATVKQQSLLNTIFIVFIAVLVIMGLLLYRNFKHKQQLTAQEQLIQQQKITELEKEKQLIGIEGMLKGQEEERSRLAKDLHDGLGGMLSGVKISFSNIKENMILDADNAVSFEKSITQLDGTIAELRKVAHNLMPEALVKFGLKSAVKDFCESMQLSGNATIICEQYGPERDLGSAADVNVYRIIQELVNNAVTHGAANQVVVQLTKTPNKVLITVEDNGKGFDLSTPKKTPGIGLSNIEYRVNYFHGQLNIDSKPNEGTSVNIELTA